jgi:Trp operon repressor
MAEKLITHNVDENERASIKLVKKLAEKDRHDEIRRRIQKEKDDVATRVSAIYEIFKGTISEKDIAKVFDRHK